MQETCPGLREGRWICASERKFVSEASTRPSSVCTQGQFPRTINEELLMPTPTSASAVFPLVVNYISAGMIWLEYPLALRVNSLVTERKLVTEACLCVCVCVAVGVIMKDFKMSVDGSGKDFRRYL